MRTLCIFAILVLSGCAARRPVPQTWRLTNNILVPPGVRGPEVAKRILTLNIKPGPGTCPQEVWKRGGRIQIALSREVLLQQPAGWLTAWTEQMEASNCISPGEASKLADAIVGALPLDTDAAFKLLYAADRQAGQVDLDPGILLQVVSPIMRDGKNFSPPVPVHTSGSGTSLDVSLSGPDMLGYETALYAIRPVTGRAGFAIAPISADRHINGLTEHAPQPANNYFQFAGKSAFYRLYYKAGQTDFTALVVAARTRSGLSANITSCDGLPTGTCIQIPRHIAVNPLITVTVNGHELQLNWASTLSAAIRAAGERQPNSVLPRLSLSKPHDGHLASVDFDHSDPKVLDLVMTGGESVTWQ